MPEPSDERFDALEARLAHVENRLEELITTLSQV
jgi:uncharacterized coiled-coil protein SlyX